MPRCVGQQGHTGFIASVLTVESMVFPEEERWVPLDPPEL